MEPSGGRYEDGAYTIHFQVWRPSPTVGSDGAGCYSLVGENRFTSITFSNRGPISETPEPSNIISVQPGDVVGYYVLSNRGGNDGIQMDSDDDSITIYYNKDNGGNPISLGPDSCQVSVGFQGLLTEITSAAPQLSIDISKWLHLHIMDDSFQFFVMCDSGTYDCHTSTTQPVVMMTSSTPSPSPTSTQVPTQTPPPITTTTPTTTQQDTDPTTPQQQDTDPTTPQQEGTDPVQGPDQSTPTTIEPSTTDPAPPDTSGNPVNAGLAGGLAVLGLATLVMAVTLTMVIALLAGRRKSHSNDDLHDNIDLHGNDSYNTKTEILAIANPACTSHGERETSTHLPPSSHVGEDDIATSTNECYSTSRLPSPTRPRVHQQQDMQLTQNQAYVTSASVSMKPNESYGTTTTSMDSDLLYATVEGEHSNSTQLPAVAEEYDYVIPHIHT